MSARDDMQSYERRRAIADAMRQQLMQNAGNNGSVANIFASALGGFMTNRRDKKLDSEYSEIAKALSQEKTAALEGLMAPTEIVATDSDVGPTRGAEKPRNKFARAQGAIDAGVDQNVVSRFLGPTGRQDSPFGTVPVEKFTPESLAVFAKSGNYGDLMPVESQGMGKYNPGQYTPESWAAFVQGKDPSVLRRYVAPQNATVTDVGGSPTIVQPDKQGGAPRITPISTPQAERDAAAASAAAIATAKGAAETAQTSAAKLPAMDSMNYVISQFGPVLEKSMQGGPLGISGKAGALFDYENAARFDTLKQQLSTEMRTIFRIPGEGSLSDQEQAQYGLQLPDRNNPKEVNQQILMDLQARVGARLGQQSAQPPVATGSPLTLDQIRAKYGNRPQ